MLVECPECKREISDAAPVCPNCGFPQKSEQSQADTPNITKPTAGTPIFLLAACGAFALALFTPRIVAILPILAATGLSVISLVRREKLAIASIGVIVISVGLYVLSAADMGTFPSSESEGPFAFVFSGCQRDGDYMIAEGTVTNQSSKSVKDAEAVVTYSDASGTFITSDDSLIDYNPILPGQTSAFKVMTTYNPAMAKCVVTFKNLMGGTIDSSQAN